MLGQLNGAGVGHLGREKVHRVLVVPELHGAALCVKGEPGHVVLTQPLHGELSLVVEVVLIPLEELGVVDVCIVGQAVGKVCRWNDEQQVPLVSFDHLVHV